VYVVGTAAAIRLLPRHTWVRRGAVVAFVATLGLLALTGKYLLPQLVVGLGAVLWMMRQRSLARRGAIEAPAAPHPEQAGTEYR